MDNHLSTALINALPPAEGVDTKSTAIWCEQLLARLAQPELEDLAAYARFRLKRVGLHPGIAEDVRQSLFGGNFRKSI